ncbi:hypothetical protein HJC23_004244 [Cyclotella cryptica]|uniref:Thioredoxin domain-containing protein n=1 Tax=Cyclotella cryptica TaxID=29204 RepID=A0ABD3Q8P7_9STRA|eukprot:CCRYP_007908-RA/>CCRYP_007908-RA protein AED:0.01 eAED:0.01 QI:190/1/1/1/0.5/0.33/3/861/336
MPSHQNPIGNSKTAKFVAANPLAPLADPFAGMGDDQKDFHKEVSNNVQKRVENAMEELREKHRTGTNEVDEPDRGPTGAAYKELYRQQREISKRAAASREHSEAKERMQQNREVEDAKEKMRRMKFQDSEYEDNSHQDSDDDFDYLLDEEDPGLAQLREVRLAQLKQEHITRATNISLGHGTLRTIVQDEFLAECTGSSRFVCVHFFQDEFERCKIMDFHLKVIAEEHYECKFLRIDAAKAPFFVTKFKIRTLPSLFLYENGKEIGRLTGFDGLASDPKKPDEWHTGRLQEWIASKGAIKYEKPSDEVAEERKRLGLVSRGAVYSNQERSAFVEEY